MASRLVARRGRRKRIQPLSGNLVNGPRSLVQNNGVPLVLQTANSDSSRAGQFDNSVGYIGLSNKTFGTLTVGRVTSLTLDGVIAYDPMGGSYAFSALGYSGSYAGFGDTETNRANTGVKYRVNYENFHGGGLVQWGGYAQGNGTTGLYQGDVGADFEGFGGLLSLDVVGSYAQNAVSLSNFTGTCSTLTKGPLKGETGCSNGIPNFYGPDDLKATLSNNSGFELLAKYKWGPVTLSGGWMWWQQANPSDDYLNGFADPRRLQRPRNHRHDEQSHSETLPDSMDQLHGLQQNAGRQCPLHRRQIFDQLPAGRQRRLLLRKPEQL